MKCYKWGQARLCTGSHALLHLPVSNARRGFPRWGMRLQTVQTVAHFRTKTKTTRILMRELLFAYDSALVAHSAEEMQKIMDVFSDASKMFGMKINIKKTDVLYQPNITRTGEEDIMVDGNKLNYVLEFTYLGRTL